MHLFFSLDRRGCFRAKLSDFFSLEHAAFKEAFGAKLSDFSATNMQRFFLSGEEAAFGAFLRGYLLLEQIAPFSHI